MKRDGPKTPAAVHGPLGITYYPNEKANVIADSLEIRFTSHYLLDENREREVRTTVQALLASLDGTTLGKVRPCDIHKLANSLKLRKGCELAGIPDECLRHLPRRPVVHLTHLFDHCLRLTNFPKPRNEAKFITLPKPGKDPKFPQNLRPINLLFTTGRLFDKVILKIVQRHMEEKCLLNEIQFGFCAHHSTTLQCMRRTDHVTLNFNNNLSTAAVFLDTEKAFDKTRHLGLLCKLSELKLSRNLIKLITSLLSQRKFRVSVEGEISTPRDIKAGVPQGSVLSLTFYSLYINGTSQTPGVYLVLFTDDTCIYATDRKEDLCSQKAAAMAQFY
jgi:hypothetical protein